MGASDAPCQGNNVGKGIVGSCWAGDRGSGVCRTVITRVAAGLAGHNDILVLYHPHVAWKGVLELALAQISASRIDCEVH